MRWYSTIGLACAIAAVLVCNGCVKNYTFPPSEKAPATMAEVKLSRDGNGNVLVDFKAKHMATPELVSDGAKIYVLWAMITDVGTFNLGRIEVNKRLNAKLSTLTPFDEVSLFVTAEKGGKVLTPSADVILETGTIKAP